MLALEKELLRLEMALFQVSMSAAVFPVLSPAYRALAMKSFEMCLEHASSVMTCLLLEKGSAKASKGSEPFRMLVARARQHGIVSDGKCWRLYRDWRNESVHHYSDKAADRILGGMAGFIRSSRGLLAGVSAGMEGGDEFM
ncbi:nucleotidyltransferase substrate binding protein [Hyphomicrobium sp. DY-1]|uniref:nucleotidyltransferase substrate binding protein n=1 Tax=Hyphomicrobium sp. DY-1 TaxID=3075650 RepID=UPI0039C3A2D6